jgi:hypothetical protein
MERLEVEVRRLESGLPTVREDSAGPTLDNYFREELDRMRLALEELRAGDAANPPSVVSWELIVRAGGTGTIHLEERGVRKSMDVSWVAIGSGKSTVLRVTRHGSTVDDAMLFEVDRGNLVGVRGSSVEGIRLARARQPSGS